MSTKTGNKPAAPKKPQGAYFIFMNEKREEFKKKFPDLSQQDLIKQIAKAYKELTTDDKKSFEDKAHKQKEEYEKLKDEYVSKYGEIPRKGKDGSEDTDLQEGRGRRRVKKSSSNKIDEERGVDEEGESKGKGKGKSKGKGSKGTEPTTSEKLSEAGKKGAEARWGKRSKSQEGMSEETQEQGGTPKNKESKSSKSRSKSKETDKNQGLTTHQKLSEAGKKGAEARWGKSHSAEKIESSNDTQQQQGTEQSADKIQEETKPQEVSNPIDQEIKPEQAAPQDQILKEGESSIEQKQVTEDTTLDKPTSDINIEKAADIQQPVTENIDKVEVGEQRTDNVGQGDQNIVNDEPAMGDQKGGELGSNNDTQEKLQGENLDRPREEAQEQQLP